MLLLQVHGLDAETWKKVDVVYIDIADRSQVEPKVMIEQILRIMIHAPPTNPLSPDPRSHCPSVQDYKPEEDPCRYKSVKTGRGPLGPDWKVPSLLLPPLLLRSVVSRSLIPLFLTPPHPPCRRSSTPRKTAPTCARTNWSLSNSSGGGCKTKWRTSSRRSVDSASGV